VSEDELKQLDAVSALPREYPGWMLERQGEYRRNQLAQAITFLAPVAHR
jgi:hypothetical protein